MNIAEYIPNGKENAVSRARLVRLTGLSDRAIRDHIKRANRMLAMEGRVILSSSGARGYWISEDPDEMKEYLRESTHRARTQYRNDSPIRSLIRRAEAKAGGNEQTRLEV